MVLQFPANESKDEGHQGQQDVIAKNTADEDNRAFVTLQDDLYVLGRGVLDQVWRKDDEPYCAHYGLHAEP